MIDRQTESAEPEDNVLVEKDSTPKPYLKPFLEELGDLRGFTLGPTPGPGESGNPFLLKA